MRSRTATLAASWTLALALIPGQALLAASDADNDGVDDQHDACAFTAADATVDSRGCEFDDDGDGVVDRVDTCPDTRRGALVNTRGCEHDSDGDGIADRLDRCAQSRPAARIDNDGCEFDDVVPMHGVKFETGSSDLTATSHAVVLSTARLLNRYRELCFTVEGYTDNVGSTGDNLSLSRERATSVASALAASGVETSRLRSVGYGENSPIASNRSAEGREKNRRVQLRVADRCEDN